MRRERWGNGDPTETIEFTVEYGDDGPVAVVSWVLLTALLEAVGYEQDEE